MFLPRSRTSLALGLPVLTLTAVLLAACVPPAGGAGVPDRPARAADSRAAAAVTGEPSTAAPGTPAPRPLPGVGPRILAEIPEGTRQVLLASGEDRDGNRATVSLYELTDGGWEWTAGPWDAHNALRGWTFDHRQGDLRSPIGVYGLSDAGGLLPDPGTQLPYDHGPGFSISGTGFRGEPLEGSFDYVVAIDYNRQPGTTPLDWTRPLGAGKGGGIWVHVDHGGPTQGCVSISERHMRDLLRALDPELDPVIVMGDAEALAA
jgi:L,D-peptidoglycan transpeptidase YkuD (ErfK/YbiS/YcfS/YnhG family)